MNNNINNDLTGRIVSVSEDDRCLAPAKALNKTTEGYKVEYAVGNIEIVKHSWVRVPPSWLVGVWHEMKKEQRDTALPAHVDRQDSIEDWVGLGKSSGESRMAAGRLWKIGFRSADNEIPNQNHKPTDGKRRKAHWL